jgi:hypothetical protein
MSAESLSDADVELFARGILKRYGKSANHYIEKRAKRLESVGDLEGGKVWRRVAKSVSSLSLKRKRGAGNKLGLKVAN